MHSCFVILFLRSCRSAPLNFYRFLFLLLVNFQVHAQAPAISAVAPNPVCQGNNVIITGTDFTNATGVKLGSLNAASFVVNDPTSITATVADLAVTGTVSVTTAGGTATGAVLTIVPAGKPVLADIGTLDAPFTNCNGNSTYLLKVSNQSNTITGTGNVYTIDWGDNTPVFTQTDWPAGAQTAHTYNAQGYYSVVFTNVSANGCSRSTTYQFYNGKNPLASFTTTASTTGLCVPAAVEFQIGNWFNNSAGTSYQIYFGDNTPVVTLAHPLNPTSSVQLLSHVYNTTSCPNSPDFTAILQAKNGCFTTTYTLNQIIIRKKPSADFTTLPSPACVTTAVCFTNTTVNGYSGNSCATASNFTWDFGDGTPVSGLTTPACHTYSAPGTYTVTLAASNTACGTDTKTKPVIVLATSPVPVVTTPVTYCRGAVAVPLMATGTGLLWYTAAAGGTGSPNAPAPATTTAGTITYYVSQSIANNCESPRVPITVTVTPLPATPAVATPVQLCENQTAPPLTAAGNGLLWYTTATGGTASTTAPTPSTTTLGSTTYYVSQTTGTCESPRAAIVVTVNALAVAPVVVSPLTYCQGQPATALTATPAAGLLWYTVATGGTGSSAAPIPSTSTVGSTIYYVSQVTGCGEGPRAAITVNVNASPSASIAFSPVNICNSIHTAADPNPPIPAILTGTAGGNYSVTPATGLTVNTTSGEINPSGATPGAYIIKYTIPGTGGCSDFITTATVTVNGAPTAVITYASPFCSSAAAANVQLTGTGGGMYSAVAGLTIDAVTGTITPATSTPGTYIVTYTVLPSPPCPGFTARTSIIITTAPSASIAYSVSNLCNVTDNAATPNPPVAVLLTGTNGGIYSVTPANGLIVGSATGIITPSGATAGVYTIKYTLPGAGGCPDFVAPANITVSAAPIATIVYRGSPFCRGINTARQVSATGNTGGVFSAGQGLSINATTGEINPALSMPGVYTVQYSIAASPPCPGYTASTTVQIDDSPVLSFATPVQSICSGGTAVYIPSSTVANTIYTWSVTGALPANVSGITAGSAAGANPSISLSFTNTGAVSQTITVQVKPSNPSQNPCPGAPYTITLTVYPIPPALLPDTFHFCLNTPATALAVNPSTGNTIKWYDNNLVLLGGSPVINTTVPTQFIYYVKQLNSFGCESPATKVIAIVHPVVKIIGASYTNPTRCGIPSGSIVLEVLDLNNNPVPRIPVTVHYDKFQTAYAIADSTDGAGKITVPLVAGVYSGIYVETYGCSSQKIPDVFILKDPNPPAQPVAGYNPPICSETPLNLTAISATSTQAGTIDYVWTGPAFGPYADTVKNTFISFPSAAAADAGTYVVYAIQNNCISATSSFQVVIKQSPSKPIISTRAPLCIGDDLVLQAYSSIPGPDPVLNYVWRGPGTGFPVNAPNAGISKVKIQDAGIYSITVNSPQTGCSSSTDTLVLIGGYPIVKFAQDTLMLPTGYLLNLAPIITNATEPGILPMKKYEWTPSQDLACNDPACSAPVATIKNNTCYAVKATNIYGCSASAAICVKVLCQSAQVFIPNAFTPRGDVPENAKLIVRASGISSVKSFRVFNRWGKILFEKNNFPPNSADFGWDGRVNGKLADPGVYIYIADVICENGIPYSFKGNVTLL